MYDRYDWADTNRADRYQVFGGVNRRPLQQHGRLRHLAMQGDQEGVAIGYRSRHGVCRNHAQAARPILDDDGNAQPGRKIVSKRASGGIIGRTWRLRSDDPDRLGRPRLGLRHFR